MMVLNAQERFVAFLTFKKVDRVPFMPGGPNAEALHRWYGEGLPPNMTFDEYLGGFDSMIHLGGVHGMDTIDFGPVPRFAAVGKGHKASVGTDKPSWVVSEDNRTSTLIDEWGVTQRMMKGAFCGMPQYIEFPVEKVEDWEEMKERFNPSDPRRYGVKWSDDLIEFLNTVDLPVRMTMPGFFWKGREFMGLENFLKAFYKNPELVDEMMEFWCDFLIKTSRKAVEAVQIDYVIIGEDMAYKTGPHLSPKTIREYILPGWKRLISFLKKNHVKLVFCDSDGNLDYLIPLWLEAGFDGSWPLEVAAGNDAVAIRKKYGKRFALFGNVDKRVLLYGKEAIDRELEYKLPLTEEGGYIPSIDHGVPSVPFENYKYYVQRLKEYIFK